MEKFRAWESTWIMSSTLVQECLCSGNKCLTSANRYVRLSLRGISSRKISLCGCCSLQNRLKKDIMLFIDEKGFWRPSYALNVFDVSLIRMGQLIFQRQTCTCHACPWFKYKNCDKKHWRISWWKKVILVGDSFLFLHLLRVNSGWNNAVNPLKW